MNRNLLTAGFIFSGLVAQAQTDTIKANQLDEVVVTANKYQQKQSTTGKVITVINKSQLEQSRGKTVSQVLNEQAGITINGALNNIGTVQTVYVRGAASGRALILMDGVPVNDPSMINNEFDLNLFSIDNIDRIEICKGAQSTLYGSDAIAGVINIITINPDAKKALNVKGTLSGGNYGTVKGSTQVYGKSGKVSYSGRYAKLRTDGFSAARDTIGNRNFDHDGYDGNIANAQVLVQATPNLSFRSFGMYSQYKSDIDAGVFADEKDYVINNSVFTGGAGFNYKKDFLTLTGTYQYSELKRTYLNDSTFKSGTIFEDNQYFGKTQFVEFYAGVNLGSGFTLLQGADYRYSSYNQQYYSVSSFGPFKSGFSDTSLSQSALYGSLNYSGTNKKLNVELGGRLNTHSRYGSNATYTFNPSYALSNRWRVFGSIASGFKAPTLYQLSINPKLEQEESVNYEAGIQYNRDRLNTRLVYFNRRINNGIDYNYITFKYFNYVRQVVNGIEYEITYKPAEKIYISGNYTFLDPRETTQNRVTNKDTVTYDYSLRRPKHQANLTIGGMPIKNLDVSVTGRYVSSRYDVGGYQRRDVLLDDYFLLSAHANYKLNTHFDFFADAQNITDKVFYDVRGYNSIPFFLNAGVAFSF